MDCTIEIYFGENQISQKYTDQIGLYGQDIQICNLAENKKSVHR